MIALLMGVRSITLEALQQAMQSHALTIIDVNAPLSWARAHIPGAVNLDPNAYLETDLPQDKAASLVFYCSNPMCRKAPTAARRAKKFGYTDVRVLSAGITGQSLPAASPPGVVRGIGVHPDAAAEIH